MYIILPSTGTSEGHPGHVRQWDIQEQTQALHSDLRNHCPAHGHCMPVSFFLLPWKSTETYCAMFNLLSTIHQEVNGENLDNKSLQIDFEKTTHKAVTEKFPGMTVKDCPFHPEQKLWRKIQDFGLSGEYRSLDSDICHFLKFTFGLPVFDYQDDYESFAFDILFQALLTKGWKST